MGAHRVGVWTVCVRTPLSSPPPVTIKPDLPGVDCRRLLGRGGGGLKVDTIIERRILFLVRMCDRFGPHWIRIVGISVTYIHCATWRRRRQPDHVCPECSLPFANVCQCAVKRRHRHRHRSFLSGRARVIRIPFGCPVRFGRVFIPRSSSEFARVLFVCCSCVPYVLYAIADPHSPNCKFRLCSAHGRQFRCRRNVRLHTYAIAHLYSMQIISDPSPVHTHTLGNTRSVMLCNHLRSGPPAALSNPKTIPLSGLMCIIRTANAANQNAVHLLRRGCGH